MEELEQNLNEYLEGSDQAIEQSEPVQEETSPEAVSSQPEEIPSQTEEVQPQYIEIEGQRLTIDEIKELQKKAKQYEALLPEFTRRSQRLKELEKKLSQSSSPEDQAKAEALKYLRENFGLVTKEDLENFVATMFENVVNYITEQQRLQEVETYLQQKYDGTVFPKYDPQAMRNYLRQKYGEDKSQWPETIDLEYEYFQMNREFFEKLPETRKKAIPTESKSVPSTAFSKPEKVVVTPRNEGEISLEDAMKKFIEGFTP